MMILTLIKDGANINGVDIETGQTFLHIVAIYNNEPLACEAIKLGAEVRDFLRSCRASKDNLSRSMSP